MVITTESECRVQSTQSNDTRHDNAHRNSITCVVYIRLHPFNIGRAHMFDVILRDFANTRLLRTL